MTESKIVQLIQLIHKEVRGDLKGVFQLNILKNGNPAGSFHLTVAPDQVGYAEGTHEKPSLTITAEDDDLVGLLSNKLDPVQAQVSFVPRRRSHEFALTALHD
mmetsp:Transcript_108378/g.169461  ORF Transcript_108378/g.169461 Transcript_108378/m.169461 type:complete len:103 (-) Transcript_108378:239-547(-)